ncbi:MAG: hypothetical protein KC619_00985 [Myxococcales bacterium]|nr:hypothetical protein [Myxococcales bacterium]
MGRRTTRSNRLSLVAQAHWLRRRYPDTFWSIRGGVLRWRGELRPTDLSRRYLVELTYTIGTRPRVFVRGPPLARFPGRKLPHVWDDGSLCLYLPKACEWAPTMRLADTIVVWASEWLFFYESWLLTGDWLGGGHEPRK